MGKTAQYSIASDMSATDPRISDRLEEYRNKRSREATPEPFGGEGGGPARVFVVQKHAARRTHYDLRLEHDGVLLSWAVPRGPCRDPDVVRLAVRTEDHPVEYADFEGVIPEGSYGAGAMIVWDRGLWVPLEIDPEEGLESGKLLFELVGYRLRGVWTLVRTKKAPREWLLIKKPDGWARPGEESELEDTSVLSGLTVEELAEGSDLAAAVGSELEALGAPPGPAGIDEIEPMLAEVAERPFSRAGWVFELKYDGYRLLAGLEGGEPKLRYRSGGDATVTFPEVARALESLPYADLVLDGEVVVLDEDGHPSFSRLQRRGRLRRPHDIRRASLEGPATLFAFDLLAFEDFDLRGLSLEARKRLLSRLIPRAGPVRYADHIAEQGKAAYERVVEMGVEGLVGKDASAPYRGGRSDRWLKIRADREAPFVIVGSTAPARGRTGFGALHLAAHREGELVYTGRVGSGFTDRDLEEIVALLAEDRVESPLVGGALPGGDEHSWVEPRHVCRVRYKELTGDGLLRQPVFLGLERDFEPSACRLDSGAVEHEPPAAVEHVGSAVDERLRGARPGGRQCDAVTRPQFEITRPDKVFWPDEGFTKGDLVDYYRTVAGSILPYLEDRPLVLDRYPDGIEGKSFFQKNAPDFTPDWIRTVTIEEGDGGRTNRYLVCEHPDALAWIANLGAIPLHLWASRSSRLERPDWCVLDLDPKEAPFANVVTVARAIRDVCDEMGLVSHVKTSGKTGLHVMVPLGGQLGWGQAKLLAELVARVVVNEHDDIATVVRNPSGRGLRVYIDYVQNGRGKLLVAPLCVRPMPGATVSTPLRWREVTPRLDVTRFTIQSVPRRLRSMKDDPLRPVLTEAPDLRAAVERLAGRLS